MKAKKHRAGSVAGINFPCFFAKNSQRITLTCFNAPAVLAASKQPISALHMIWMARAVTYLPLYNDACVDEIFQFACENHADLTYVTLNKHLIIMGCTFSKKHFRRFSKKQKVSKSPLLMIFVQNMNKTCYFTSVSFLKSVSVLSTFIHCDVIKGYTPF